MEKRKKKAHQSKAILEHILLHNCCMKDSALNLKFNALNLNLKFKIESAMETD